MKKRMVDLWKKGRKAEIKKGRQGEEERRKGRRGEESRERERWRKRKEREKRVEEK